MYEHYMYHLYDATIAGKPKLTILPPINHTPTPTPNNRLHRPAHVSSFPPAPPAPCSRTPQVEGARGTNSTLKNSA